MLYEAVMPCSAERHGNWWVETGADYSFAAQLTLAPLCVTEFARAVFEYAIAFGGQDQALMPVAILGLQPDRNSYVGDDGSWRASYVPAYVRRYPFLLASTDGGKTVSLCIDESSICVNQSGRGIPLFAGNGQVSPQLETIVAFLKNYERDYAETRAFCARLQSHRLLTPIRAQLTSKSGRATTVSGLLAIDRDRLSALPAAAIDDLFRSDALRWIHLHELSLQNL